MRGERKLLLLLSGAFVLDHMDRHILSITLEMIGRDFDLSDLQLGALSGLAFAFLFTLLGFPLARLARPGRRKTLAVAAVAVWSGLTALTAAAGGYAHLFLARMGVAAGEAGFTPAAHSMVADAVSPERRASAFAVFSAGANLGLFLAFLVGGFVAAAWGWRAAFLIAGLPGLALALVLRIWLQEPPARAAPPAAEPSFAGVWRRIMADVSTRCVIAGALLTATVNYGAIAWVATFLIRRHELAVEQAGLYLALTSGLLGGAATVGFGILADRLGARNPAWRLGLVAGLIVLAKAMAIAAYMQDGVVACLVLLAFPALASGVYLGPTFGHVYSRIPAAERPRATAIILFLLNLIGIGAGPVFVGAVSTWAEADGMAQSPLSYGLVALQAIGLLGGLAFAAAAFRREVRRRDHALA